MQIIKKSNAKSQIIYFDVDDTLIFESHHDEFGSFVLNDGDGWFYYKAHKNHVAEFKKLYEEGHQLVIWTSHQLGEEWAAQVAIALGLDKLSGKCEIICIAKPDRFYDDMSAQEIFDPSLRWYLSKN